MKATKYLSKLAEKRTRNVLAIIAMFACTSICFGALPGNTITLNSNVTHGKDVAGNSVNPNGAGPFSLSNLNHRTLIIAGARVGEASGAYIYKYSGSDAVLTMTGNEIVVDGGNFTGNNINGAYSFAEKKVNVIGNTAKINAGSNIEGIYSICGGHTFRGTAYGNKVFINNEVMTIVGDVYGGRASGNGNANGNRVTITDATVNDVYGGFANGNGNKVNANGNRVTITKAIVNGSVYGSHIGDDGNGNANGNRVTITDATVNGSVNGGSVQNNGNANNNEITIDGGSIRGDVFGGYVFGSDNGNATGNTITIINSPKFGDGTVLSGGTYCNKGLSDAFTRNKLIIKKTKGITVRKISNFEDCEFYLPEDIEPKDPVLTIRDANACDWGGVKLDL